MGRRNGADDGGSVSRVAHGRIRGGVDRCGARFRRSADRQADGLSDDRVESSNCTSRRDAASPLVYKKRYLDLLDTRIAHRLEELREDRSAASKCLVPGSLELLEALRERGLTLYLASGTDQDYMRREAVLLGVTPFFDGGVFGALDDYKSFSKKMLIEKIIAGAECHGHEILAFGDGYIEIENVKAVGGIAVGVASDEPECRKVDEWKRDRLAGVGADYIIPHFLCRAELFDHLFTA